MALAAVTTGALVVVHAPATAQSAEEFFKKKNQLQMIVSSAAGGGYDSYFLLDGAPVQPTLIQWTRVADTSLQAQGGAVLFLSNRSAFIEVAGDRFSYTVPAPWTP